MPDDKDFEAASYQDIASSLFLLSKTAPDAQTAQTAYKENISLKQACIKLGFLSEVHTDFVLAGIAEEVGVLGILFITSLIIFLIYRIFKISARSENKVNHLFALGIGLVISFSFLMNSYGITSITPIKGIAVPFLSYGGSSILSLCIGIGMVLMISKRAKL